MESIGLVTAGEERTWRWIDLTEDPSMAMRCLIRLPRVPRSSQAHLSCLLMSWNCRPVQRGSPRLVCLVYYCSFFNQKFTNF